jgi:hypothetical protein
VYGAKKPKDCNRSGEIINIKSCKIKFIYYLHHSCNVIENPTTNIEIICLLKFLHPKVIDHMKHSFGKKDNHLETLVKEVELDP